MILNLPFELSANPDNILFSDGNLPLNLIDWYEKLTERCINFNFNSSDYRLLSKGCKYLLDLVASIYYCYPDSTVLIDDIEQNLDMQTQRKLLPFLIEQRPDLQFIVTTHSPEIIDGKSEWLTSIETILTEI
jgi:predicted ATP-dependent endonuclease of OLD family